jgi:hypothetical protein
MGYFIKQSGHCTRCGDPFGGNRWTAFMVGEERSWRPSSHRLGDRCRMRDLRDFQRASHSNEIGRLQGLRHVHAVAGALARRDVLDALRPALASASTPDEAAELPSLRPGVQNVANRRQVLLERMPPESAPRRSRASRH